MELAGCGKVKESHKNILILIIELSLCVFAIGNCISHWIHNPGENSIGTSVINFISYFALAIFFIVIFIKNKN